jgi:DNA ligase-associated metallophosphoesterase
VTPLEVGGEQLALLPEKAVWWPDRAALLVADAHFGKAVSFRRLGVPVPPGTTADNLAALTLLVDRLGARHIVFLGDFLHSAHAHAADTLAELARWRARHARLDLVLVRGNHDDRAGDPPVLLGFAVVDEPLALGRLALCHRPQPRDGAYVLAGHLHPCVLPAFGGFTGMHPITRLPGDRVFAVAVDAVVEVPT